MKRKNVELSGSPSVQTLIAKIDGNLLPPNTAEIRRLVLEMVQLGTHRKIFLALYLPTELTPLYGGLLQMLTPPDGIAFDVSQLAPDDCLDVHGVRLNLVEVDLDTDVLCTEKTTVLSDEEVIFLASNLPSFSEGEDE